MSNSNKVTQAEIELYESIAYKHIQSEGGKAFNKIDLTYRTSSVETLGPRGGSAALQLSESALGSGPGHLP